MVFQTDVAQGNYAQALEQLDAFADDDVSALLDRGLLLQAQNRYQESNQSFEAAERLIEDLYTRSISKELLALLTSDQALEYRASGFEHAYISYYRAWNYLQLGQPEGVLVEARRINERLTFRSESCEDQGGACGHDAFLRYFSGLLFEWGGELNDAYIAYKQADLACSTSRDKFGMDLPPDLGERLTRLARWLGFKDEAAAYTKKFDLKPESGKGHASSVVVLWENGMIGRREEITTVIPIMKGETKEISKDRERWSHTLAGRRHHSYEKKELDYLLRISLPTYVSIPPRGRRAEVTFSGRREGTEPLTGLSVMAEDALEQAMGGILVRAIARGLVKYLAKETAEKEIGKGAGLVVNLLGVSLENADVRSWRSLPYEIQVASLPVKPGKYTARLTVLGQGGTVLEERDFSDIQVPQGGIAFIRHRSTP